jgi:hypothetical protein
MTTRNFRVNNGLSVGDIVISANANTITGGATAAPNADGQFANKKYVDDGLAGLSQTSISSGTTNVTVASTTAITTISGAAALTIGAAETRVHGNLIVDGTETTLNTSTLSVEDNIIEVNRNVSTAGATPTISGMLVNRGEGSTAANKALLWAWDDTFADDGTTIHGNHGGAWTAYARERTSSEAGRADNLVDIRANVIHAMSTSAQYADVAERFEADAPMATGAVVEVGGIAEITETTSDLSENVFGVISTQPAYAMNAGAGNNDSHPFVAMTGRTPVRVTGEVTKGQRLVTSSVKGCARAVATGESISPFNVIGRALESSIDAGIKLVNCAVRTNN